MAFMYNRFVLKKDRRNTEGCSCRMQECFGKDVNVLMTSGNGFFQYRIMLRPDEVKDFVRAASNCDFDIDISYNSYVVDAKSILGVLSLDLRKILTVEYDGENEELEAFLNEKAASKYKAA